MDIQEPTKLDMLKVEYQDAMHAMQTGVAHMIERDRSEASLKHIRVGINSALCSVSALMLILVEKGLVTEEEYFTKLLELVKEDVKDYEAKLTQLIGKPITLH